MALRVALVLLLAHQSLATRATFLGAEGLPDPHCKTGVISLAGGKGPQACCAGYCGECSDYPTCERVRNQDSGNACCASKVAAMACDAGAPANVCLKKCSESVPPCIMDEGEEFKFPKTKRSAGDDCNDAVPAWMSAAKSAVTGAAKETDGPDGEQQWKTMAERNFVPSSVIREKMEKLVGHLPEGFSFKVLDGNGDGGLSTDEMQKFFTNALPGGYDATVVNAIHDAFDSNKDGQVSPVEMAAGMAGLGGPAPTAFLQAMICVLHQ